MGFLMKNGVKASVIDNHSKIEGKFCVDNTQWTSCTMPKSVKIYFLWNSYRKIRLSKTVHMLGTKNAHTQEKLRRCGGSMPYMLHRW